MEDVAAYWDDQAQRFDDEPDHGLRDPAVRAAWEDLLLTALPPPPASVGARHVRCGSCSARAVGIARSGACAGTLDRTPQPWGTLALVEGRWCTGAGLSAREVTEFLEGQGLRAAVTPLTDASLWGRPISDERYLVVSASTA